VARLKLIRLVWAQKGSPQRFSAEAISGRAGAWAGCGWGQPGNHPNASGLQPPERWLRHGEFRSARVSAAPPGVQGCSGRSDRLKAGPAFLQAWGRPHSGPSHRSATAGRPRRGGWSSNCGLDGQTGYRLGQGRTGGVKQGWLRPGGHVRPGQKQDRAATLLGAGRCGPGESPEPAWTCGGRSMPTRAIDRPSWPGSRRGCRVPADSHQTARNRTSVFRRPGPRFSLGAPPTRLQPPPPPAQVGGRRARIGFGHLAVHRPAVFTNHQGPLHAGPPGGPVTAIPDQAPVLWG